MLRRLVGVLLASVLLFALAACGDDDDAGGGGGGGGGSDVASDTTEADQEAVDAATEALIAFLEDEGFEPTGDEDDETDLEFESEECQEFADSLPGDDQDLEGETASSEIEEYGRGELDASGGTEDTAEAGVGFVEDPSVFDEVFDVLGDDLLAECLEEAFVTAIEQGAEEDNISLELNDVSVEQVGDLGLGERSLGINLAGSFTVQGLDFPFGFQVGFVTEGRMGASAMVGVVGAEEPDIDAVDILQVLLDEATSAGTAS